MNNLKQILKIENRNKIFNYFRTSTYLAHPELKVKLHKERWRNLATMRDLRQWIHEYAPHSSRSEKYSNEIEQLTREIQYLQFFSFSKRFFIFFGLTLFFAFFGPEHWRGTMDSGSRPTYIIYNIVLQYLAMV
jgi:hypothetical protein